MLERPDDDPSGLTESKANFGDVSPEEANAQECPRETLKIIEEEPDLEVEQQLLVEPDELLNSEKSLVEKNAKIIEEIIEFCDRTIERAPHDMPLYSKDDAKGKEKKIWIEWRDG